MRVAFLNPSGHLGGAEVCLMDMLAVVRESRPHWQIFVVLGEDGPLEERARKLGASVTVLPFPEIIAKLGDSGQPSRIELAMRLAGSTPSVLKYRRELRRVLAELSPGIVHSNGLKMHVLGAMAKPRGSKLVWHLHDYLSSRAMMASLLKHFSPSVDSAIAVSNSVAEDARRVLPGTEIVPMLNVVDLDEFSPCGEKIEVSARPGDVRFGLIATMAWWKGHRLFLEAIAELDPQLPFHGYIVGGAVYQTGSRQESLDSLREYAAKLGVAGRVTFTGFQPKPAAVMRAMDVVVHASTEPEPFGRVIVEAMACGKPVISSGIGGAAEILAFGEGATKFEPGDAKSLAAAITRQVQFPEFRAKLGRNAITMARNHFGRDRLTATLPRLYEEMTGTRNSASTLLESRIHASEASGGTSNESIYSAILRAVGDLNLSGRVLDYGSGTGSLARRLSETRRFECVAAADLMQKPSGLESVRWIEADLNSPVPSEDESFDAVVAAEVIEHLENPRAMARDLFRLLKPGGAAIVSTPNNESWRSLISLTFRGHHVAFCNGSYPAHITALVRKDLERVLREAGFDSPDFRYTDFGGVPGKPTTTWQQISAGKLRGLRYSDNVVAVCRKPVRVK